MLVETSNGHGRFEAWLSPSSAHEYLMWQIKWSQILWLYSYQEKRSSSNLKSVKTLYLLSQEKRASVTLYAQNPRHRPLLLPDSGDNLFGSPEAPKVSYCAEIALFERPWHLDVLFNNPRCPQASSNSQIRSQICARSHSEHSRPSYLLASSY